MYDFAYHKPATVADAVKLLAADGDAKALAGGQTLIPTLKQRLAKPSAVVDLSAIKDLVGISVGGGKITIGAMTRHGDGAASASALGASFRRSWSDARCSRRRVPVASRQRTPTCSPEGDSTTATAPVIAAGVVHQGTLIGAPP